MVLLLVVGLAAVIIVILIAVFLSVRLGRSDDHDEPMGRSSERGRGRPDADDPGWRDEQAPRHSPAGRRRPRGSGPGRRGRTGAIATATAAARSAVRPPGPVTTTSRSVGPGATTPAPLEQPADARRPVTASSRRPGSGRDHSGRRAGTGRPESTTALYDTGPARHPVADDFPSEPLQRHGFSVGRIPFRLHPISLGFPRSAPRTRPPSGIAHRARTPTNSPPGRCPRRTSPPASSPPRTSRPRKCPPPAPGRRREDRPRPGPLRLTPQARQGAERPEGPLAQARRR